MMLLTDAKQEALQTERLSGPQEITQDAVFMHVAAEHLKLKLEVGSMFTLPFRVWRAAAQSLESRFGVLAPCRSGDTPFDEQ